jgi:hypothetical protein
MAAVLIGQISRNSATAHLLSIGKPQVFWIRSSRCTVRAAALEGGLKMALEKRSLLAALAVVAVTSSIFIADPGYASAHATKPLPRVTVTGKVLVGDAKSFRSVGVVDRRKVFEEIPAIKTLRAERVSKDSARYHFLLYEANRRFQRALDKAATKAAVDLVVESGGVSAAGIEVVDLTAATKLALGAEK